MFFVDPLTIAAFAAVGLWLESIGDKHGLIDELLAPLPLGLGGLLLVFIERLPEH